MLSLLDTAVHKNMGKLKKLLRVDSIGDRDLVNIADLAFKYFTEPVSEDLLKGKVAANLFFESSTRTLLAFEIAEKSLGATALTLNMATSSINKGESFYDTLFTLAAMGIDLFVIRTKDSDFLDIAAEKIGDSCIVNAGDGVREHPTQAITDYCTIRYLKGENISGLNVTICGDVRHSRVARSNIKLLSRHGVNVTVVAPECFMPLEPLEGVSYMTQSLEEGLKSADVIMILRIQKERIAESTAISEQEYASLYMLDQKRLMGAEKKDVVVMHPGPMNRGVEISDEVANKSTAILLQVKMGVAVRKAILHYMLV